MQSISHRTQMTSVRTRFRIDLVISAFALLLVACGASATPPPGTGDPTATTADLSQPTTPPTSLVEDEAEGSGCSPGSGTLADGEWFGYIVANTASDIDFDLACWFTGPAATRAAAEDGEESPPPNDFYVRNINPSLRAQKVTAGADVIWYPEPGDPTSEASTTYANWIVASQGRELVPGVWLTIQNGEVTRIHEQWVP
jgi:hypothetical protein